MRYLLKTLAFVLLSAPALAEENRLDALFESLARVDEPSWERIEDAIWQECQSF